MPGLVMAVSYSRMCSKLWRDNIVGNYSDALMLAKEKKKKKNKMFVVIVILFGICWLPYNIYFLYIFHLLLLLLGQHQGVRVVAKEKIGRAHV